MKIYRYDDDHGKWTVNNFPFNESNLNPNVQEKAVEIANKLYEEGEPAGDLLYDKAVAKAKEWFLEMEG